MNIVNIVDKLKDKNFKAEQKAKVKKYMENYNRNLRNLGLHAQKIQIENNLSYTDIATYAGVSRDAVTEFLKGNSVPHAVIMKAIIASIEILRKNK